MTTQARGTLAALRRAIDAESLDETTFEGRLDALAAEVAVGLEATLGAPPRRVINATGVFLHTNLGRAPLPPEVAGRLPGLSTASCDLELDLAAGERGDRSRRLAARLVALTGAEAALVVNNNAAALVLALGALAAGREVVVSRGELVEIGGSFRIPEILAAAGARLVEVGTTNRTRAADYERAIGPETALLLKVHPSNYRMSGFVETTSVAELARLARESALPLVVDEGAGLLARPASPRAPERFPAAHASVAELLDQGADVVASSGDKLLGGPQAGLLCGRSELVARLARHPLYRALRPGRLVALALDETLRRRLAGEPMPLDRLWPDEAAHAARLGSFVERTGAAIEVREAFAGGGAAPGEGIPGAVAVFAGPGREAAATRLRTGEPSVVGYVRDGRLVIDLRTVDPADDEALADAVRRALGGTST